MTQPSAPSPLPLSCMLLQTASEKNTPWQMIFADDVVLCAADKNLLEDDLGLWREALEERK